MLESKVSVIVPIYNSELYLSACVNSIINQTYSNLEIILIDDGSTDSSLQICEDIALKDSRVVVYHQENKGVSAARNIGIEMSRGEYITFVDSDDELLENCIFVLMKDIKEFKANIASGAQINVSSDGKSLNSIVTERPCVSRVISNKDPLRLSLAFDRRMTSCHGKLFCRKFIEDIRFEEGRRINEDFFFMFVCCMKEPTLTFNDECVYKYYYRDSSASRTAFSEKYFDMIYFAELKKQMIVDRYPDLINEALCMEVSTHLFLLNLLCLAKGRKYRAAEKNSIQVVVENYKNYVTSNKFEKRLAWIVVHGLYPIYKLAFRIKYLRK